MRTTVHQTAQLGDLVVAAFDQAARYSTDPREVSHLAARAVRRMLRRGRRTSLRLLESGFQHSGAQVAGAGPLQSREGPRQAGMRSRGDKSKSLGIHAQALCGGF